MPIINNSINNIFIVLKYNNSYSITIIPFCVERSYRLGYDDIVLCQWEQMNTRTLLHCITRMHILY